MSLIHPESIPGDFLLRIQECPECETDRRPRIYMCSFHDGQLTELHNEHWSGPPSLATVANERDRLRASIEQAIHRLNATRSPAWCKDLADDFQRALRGEA